jgi:hypothetical protein
MHVRRQSVTGYCETIYKGGNLMKATFNHSIELIRVRLTVEHIRDSVIERTTALYKKVKEATSAEDVVLFVWIVLVSYLLFTGYCKFGECGKIIGLYQQLRF